MFFQEKINVLWISFGFKYCRCILSNERQIYCQSRTSSIFWLRLFYEVYWEGSERAAWRSELEWDWVLQSNYYWRDGPSLPLIDLMSQKPIFVFSPLTWSVRGLARKCSHSCSMIPEVTRPASETEQESSGLSTMARISAASGVGGRVVSSITGGILKNNRSCGKLIWNLIKG